MATKQTIPSTLFFDKEERQSPESDYGVHWYEGHMRIPHRVSYIKSTGEVYAINLHTQEVEVLGVVPADPDPCGKVWCDQHIWYATLDKILDCWWANEQTEHDLQWVRNKLAEVKKVETPEWFSVEDMYNP